MQSMLPPLRLIGAKVLKKTGLQDRSLAFESGLITKGPLPEIDLSGYWILPGIVDLHGDGFEHHLAPRPTAPFDKMLGLASADRELAANGVTTAYFAQSWSWEGGIRSERYCEDLTAALARYRANALCDIRLQIRYETHMVDTEARLLDMVKRFGIDYVVFNNHLTEIVELGMDNEAELALWAKKNGHTLDGYMANVHAALARDAEVPASLAQLAEAFDDLGVTYGSHDDVDAGARDRFHALGARICEFPTSIAAAQRAKAMNDPVLMGAPNVVRGGSQSGNIGAEDLIRKGLCDILVSDYYYPALQASVWALVDSGACRFEEAWAMISTRPAETLRMEDRGRLRKGMRADFVVMNPETRQIEATICGGKLAYLAGEAGRRFLSSPFLANKAA